MAQNIKINEYTGQFVNPAVQLNTSITQIMNESIDLPTSDDMQFTSELVKDYSPLDSTDAFRIFKVDDPLTYRKYDPKAAKAAREQDAVNAQSATNAANINPVLDR